MAKDINLLPDITLQEEKDEKLRKLLTLVSISILVLGAVVLLGLFAALVYLRDQNTKIVETNEKYIQEINEYQIVELNQRDIKSKISAITTIRKDSKEYNKFIELIEENTPDGINLTTIDFAVDDTVTLNGTALTEEIFNTFVKNLLVIQNPAEEDEKPIFVDIALPSVNKSQDNTYQFTFNMAMNIKNFEGGN